MAWSLTWHKGTNCRTLGGCRHDCIMTLDWVSWDVKNRATYLKGGEKVMLTPSCFLVCYSFSFHFLPFVFVFHLCFSRKLLPVFFIFFLLFIYLFFAFLFDPGSIFFLSVSLKMKTFLVIIVRFGVFVRLRIREL